MRMNRPDNREVRGSTPRWPIAMRNAVQRDLERVGGLRVSHLDGSGRDCIWVTFKKPEQMFAYLLRENSVWFGRLRSEDVRAFSPENAKSAVRMIDLYPDGRQILSKTPFRLKGMQTSHMSRDFSPSRRAAKGGDPMPNFGFFSACLAHRLFVFGFPAHLNELMRLDSLMHCPTRSLAA